MNAMSLVKISQIHEKGARAETTKTTLTIVLLQNGIQPCDIDVGETSFC